MALTEPLTPQPAGVARGPRFQRTIGGGTSGNEQLTAMTGVILLVLFAVLGVTIIWIGHDQMLWLHLFLGVVLVGPVALKLGSTGYRFVRYYTSNPAYRRKGPPHLVMRVLGPLLIASTVAVFFTGLLLLIDGPGAPGTVRYLHKVTFFVWLGAVAIHVLWHLLELPRALRAVRPAAGRGRDLPGSRGRGLAILVTLLGGLVAALIFLPDIHIWTAGLAYHPYHISLQ